MVDSEGNETTVLTRSVDGKTFEKTTTKRQSGEVEVKEDWSNVDPGKMENLFVSRAKYFRCHVILKEKKLLNRFLENSIELKITLWGTWLDFVGTW